MLVLCLLFIVLLTVVSVMLFAPRTEQYDTTRCNALIGPAADHVFNVTLINGMTAHDLFVQSVNWLMVNTVFTQINPVINVGPLTILFLKAPYLPTTTTQNVPSIIFGTPSSTSALTSLSGGCQVTVGVTATFVVPEMQILGLGPTPVQYSNINVNVKGNLSLVQDPADTNSTVLNPQLTDIALDLTGQPYENLITSAMQSVNVVELVSNLFLQSKYLMTSGIRVPMPLTLVCSGLCAMLKRYGCC
jgi:hypothetical protein